MSFPARPLFHTCYVNMWLEELCILCNSTGKGSWNLAPGFLCISPHSPFVFADFTLSPFTAINHSPEYNCMPSPLNGPSELWN